MFNIGGGEILVILMIALIVLGPQRLPTAARQVGKAMGELKRLSSGFQNEIRAAIDVTDDEQPIPVSRRVPEAVAQVSDQADNEQTESEGCDTEPERPPDT